MRLPLVLVMSFVISAMAQNLYVAASATALSCSGGVAGCLPDIPGGSQQNWVVPTPFGGALPGDTSTSAASGALTTNENTAWLIFKNFTKIDGVFPGFNTTRRGMEIKFRLVTATAAVSSMVRFEVPADSLHVVMPDGTFLKRSTESNNKMQSFDSSISASSSLEVKTPDASAASDTWGIPAPSNEKLETFPLDNSEFGFAVFVKCSSAGLSPKRVDFAAAEIRVWWTSAGETTSSTMMTTTTTSGGAGGNTPNSGTTTASASDSKVGLIVGATIGGLVGAAALALLIIFLARRAAVAQPAIRLDAPLT